MSNQKMNSFWKKLPRPFMVLAPMENVTDFVFREVVSKYLPKPDVCFTEFTNVDALNSGGFEKTIHRFKFSDKQRPIVAQIWGTNPENFMKSAKIAEDLGFNGIDINMGCPVRAVTKIGACSALINNQALASEIIKATREGAKNLPISVKTRIGFKTIVTDDWITFLLEQKIDALTIHGRTAKQLSDIPANWDEIAKAVKIKNRIAPETIIIGNGDIKSRNEAIKKHEETGVDGVMVGRGIFSNPWVFERKEKVHKFDDYKKVLLKHLEMYDNTMHYDKLKKFFKMYINNFSGASNLRAILMETKNINEALKILEVAKLNPSIKSHSSIDK